MVQRKIENCENWNELFINIFILIIHVHQYHQFKCYQKASAPYHIVFQ